MLSFQQICELGEAKVDLAKACFALDCEVFPEINIDTCLEKINQMVHALASRVRAEKRPKRKIQVLSVCLFDEQGFRAGPLDEGKRLDSFLSMVIGHREGYCTGLSLLYLVLGERLQLPLYGVLAHKHFFTRYDDGTRRRNIEATHCGMTFPDTHYRRFGATRDSPYLRNLSKKEVLGHLLANRACFFYGAQQRYVEAAWESRRALRLFPRHPYAYINLAVALKRLGQEDEAARNFERALEIDPSLTDMLIPEVKR